MILFILNHYSRIITNLASTTSYPMFLILLITVVPMYSSQINKQHGLLPYVHHQRSASIPPWNFIDHRATIPTPWASVTPPTLPFYWYLHLFSYTYGHHFDSFVFIPRLHHTFFNTVRHSPGIIFPQINISLVHLPRNSPPESPNLCSFTKKLR